MTSEETIDTIEGLLWMENTVRDAAERLNYIGVDNLIAVKNILYNIRTNKENKEKEND